MKEVPSGVLTSHPLAQVPVAGETQTVQSQCKQQTLDLHGSPTGNMSYEAILNVGVMHKIGATEETDDLFAATVDTSNTGATDDPVVVGQYQSGVTLQSTLMKAVHDGAISGQAVIIVSTL